MQVPNNNHRGTNWWVHVHNLPAKQKVPKLSRYYSSIYSRLSDAMAGAKGKSIGNGT